jgi:dTMP kinase
VEPSSSRSDHSPGRFISLEGPEGAGKTVQAERLAAALRSRGFTVRLTREPGGTMLGERLRELLLEPGQPRIAARADALLFNTARAQLVSEVIRPALEAGEVVVCARYGDSTLAYQGFGEGVDLAELRRLGTIATGGLSPDRTILLDVPIVVGLGRKAAADRTRFEMGFDQAFHERVRAGFLELARDEPARFRVVDANRPPDLVFGEVLQAALEVL